MQGRLVIFNNNRGRKRLRNCRVHRFREDEVNHFLSLRLAVVKNFEDNLLLSFSRSKINGCVRRGFHLIGHIKASGYILYVQNRILTLIGFAGRKSRLRLLNLSERTFLLRLGFGSFLRCGRSAFLVRAG